MAKVRMKPFRPLLIDRANLRVPGLQVLSLAVHRHLPEHASVNTNRHPWCQAIVYLRGAGVQTIRGSRTQIEPGSLVVLPPRVPHAFERKRQQAPLCVLIDFRLRSAAGRRAVVCSLSRSELSQLREQVAYLLRLQTNQGQALRWEAAVPILQMMLTLLRAAGWIERLGLRPGRTQNPALQQLLTTVVEKESLADVVRQSGYHRDHLNRVLKQETGLTLGQYRAQHRLTRAQELLRQGMQVAAVGAAIGLPDQSYFARWFRRQTGQTPSAWARQR